MILIIKKLWMFWRGVFWLKKNPRYFILLLFPFVAGLLFLLASWILFVRYDSQIMTWFLPEEWLYFWGEISFYFFKILLYGLTMVAALPLYLLLVNVLSAPVYDYVSLAVEKKWDVNKKDPPELSFLGSLALIKEELKKVVFILVINIVLLVLPGGAFLTPVVSAVSLGWDYYDYPLARRGWSFRQRLFFVSKNLKSVFALGIWLLIPGLQFFFLPLAVVGGTMLALEDLNSSQGVVD